MKTAEEIVTQECPYCGKVNEPMGILGQRVYFRCEDCGMEYSKKIEDCK